MRPEILKESPISDLSVVNKQWNQIKWTMQSLNKEEFSWQWNIVLIIIINWYIVTFGLEGGFKFPFILNITVPYYNLP